MGYLTEATALAAEKLQEAIDKGNIDVPVLPETAHRVLDLTQDPDSDAAQLAGVIQADPTLGGHVMRIANSAAYTPNSNLVSIQQAIARLGMIEISQIALSTSLNSKMFNAPGYESTISTIWRHALCSALWSKEVARAMRSNVEAAFLCGLLHSIGQPVIVQAIADMKLPEQLEEDSLLQLFKHYENSYSDTVLKEWGLPAIVAEAIVYYKQFASAPNEKELAAIVAYGAELGSWMLNPESQDTEELKNSDALDIINLYPDEVEKLLGKIDHVKATMETLSL